MTFSLEIITSGDFHTLKTLIYFPQQLESEDLLVGNEHELLKVRYTKSKKPSAIQLRQTSLNT